MDVVSEFPLTVFLEKTIVSLDDILVKMEKALSVINSTDTDVVKEDKLSRATEQKKYD